MKRAEASFRDPSGRVFIDGDSVIRTVNEYYVNYWNEAAAELLPTLSAVNKISSYTVIQAPVPEAALGLEVEKLPFISYPYEWSFPQLKDAALLTLDLHMEALKRNQVLKDANAYNIQFKGVAPLLIDLLSFEPYRENTTWLAYRQFCMHFLAPLALIQYLGPWAGTLSKLRTDGVPLQQAAALLPFKARLRPGLALHLFAHAAMEAKYVDARKSAEKAKNISFDSKKMTNMALSLFDLVKNTHQPRRDTQWGEYYTDTNYSEAGFNDKKEAVGRIAREHGAANGLAIDFGANTGVFTEVIAPFFAYTLAPDIDPNAVAGHYEKLKTSGSRNILPLVQDLSNPSPGAGWASEERDSFKKRCRAKFISALALIHHVVLTEGIPFDIFAAFLADILDEDGILLLEFVPFEDSQIQRMTAARKDDLSHYNSESYYRAFSQYFEKVDEKAILESKRTLCVWRKRSI